MRMMTTRPPAKTRQPHQVCRSILRLRLIVVGVVILLAWSESTIPTALALMIHPPFPFRSTSFTSRRQRRQNHHPWRRTSDDVVVVVVATVATNLANTVNNAETVKNEWQQDRLLSLLSYIDNNNSNSNSNVRKVLVVPCGLDATEKERQVVATVIQQVEEDAAHNWATLPKGKITFDDLKGEWNLLYTSSRTICIINKSLSGLGRSSSDMAQFTSLVQKLGGNKFIGTVELVETFGTKKEDSNNDDDKNDDATAAESESESAAATPFEVTITGEWFLKPETNPFTGAPMTALQFELDKVMYGPQTNKADDWSSLGPIRLVDIIYLSKNVLITRGNANSDSLFVWERIK